ncbi:DUF4857 domain-containing protein [Bacteroides sp.]|uniref:DUF4857 domain-containing protein n=1 Tax=Bacteroides sp. TaxID=29523 RepID=UPI002FCB99DD
MTRFSKLFLYFTVALLLLWQLPWCYRFFTSKAEKSPFTLYSTVIGDFVQMSPEGDKGLVRRDLKGNLYTQAEFDSILPLFYARQLMADERFPDSIRGVAVTPRMAQVESFTFRVIPSDINAPHIRLYPLLESMSGRVDLKMPDDVFRITNRGIEFVDIASNSIDLPKSKQFTQAMLRKGFRFPALEIAGNPTTRKEYDEGYLLLDANRQLFHLKKTKDRPYVRNVQLPHGLQLEHLFVTEFKNRRTLAFMTDTDHAFYALNNKTYEVVKIGVPSYDPQTEAITILGNMFDWTIRIASTQTDNYYAVRADDYSLIKKFENQSTESDHLPSLAFTAGMDKFVKLRVE